MILLNFIICLRANIMVIPSYSVIYEDYFFRVERSISMYGVTFCMRKMPKNVPDLDLLGYPPALTEYLAGLGQASGLILLGGATGSGKTTTVSSLLREYLIRNGGLAYTIEDPFKMSLDGEYHAVFNRTLQTNTTGRRRLGRSSSFGAALQAALYSGRLNP